MTLKNIYTGEVIHMSNILGVIAIHQYNSDVNTKNSILVFFYLHHTYLIAIFTSYTFSEN